MMLPPLLEYLGDYGMEGNKENIRGRDVAERIKGYRGFVDLLPNSNAPAVVKPLSGSNDAKKILTHARLKQFILTEFDLCRYGLEEGCRVSIIIPNGPELAVAIISVISRWCAAPINPNITKDEIRSELLSTKAKAMIILADAAVNTAALRAAEEIGLTVLVITPSEDAAGLFSISMIRRTSRSGHSNDITPAVADTFPGFVHYDHPRTVLVLHTSGTSGRKKLVPYSLDMVINGVGCIVSSWNLKPSDVCMNMMPLFHIGGIMRNILSPILSGGSVIACSSFDPILFWDILEKGQRVSWYYAAPTMHHALLMEAANRPKPLPVNSIRFVANAAGGLLPVLAEGLRDTFNAVILTSYGMTECMPISSPPQTYRLYPSGTSGIPVGPDVIIVDLDDTPVRQVGPGVKGNILVRGSPCFGGYENDSDTNKESFFVVDGKDGWFNTGDVGHLDANNYLFISGRSKEVINRGGETISPFEIEEAIIQHPLVKETIAFSATHEKFQETVGVVIVPYPHKPRPDLVTLQKYLEDKLHWSKMPQAIIYMDALPKNANGKTLRINMAERTGLGDIDEESSQLSRLFEGKCPEINTPLSARIPISKVEIDYSSVRQFLLDNNSSIAKAIIIKVDLPRRHDTFVAFVEIPGIDDASEEAYAIGSGLQKLCMEVLHQYEAPQLVHVMGEIPTGSESIPMLHHRAMKLLNDAQTIIMPRNQVEKDVEVIWRNFLGATSTISVDLSFFELGGDSLKAGQLVTKMRKTFDIDLNVADLLSAPTIEAIAKRIDDLKKVHGSSDLQKPPSSTRNNVILELLGLDIFNQGDDDEYRSADCISPFSSSSFSCLLMQSFPLLLIGPSLVISKWFLWAFYWSLMERVNVGGDRLVSLIVAILMMRTTVAIIGPLIVIALKWIIVGRFKPGRYQLWGGMYLRWWIVSQIALIIGKGIFSGDFPFIGSKLLRLYYIMMGAKIGRGAKIHKDAKLGEWDLIFIGDDVCIDDATIQPFALDEGHFILLPIKIRTDCSIGAKSVIIPGTDMPIGTHLGPLSSTYEMQDAKLQYRDYCRPSFDDPPLVLLLLGYMILSLIGVICRIPWLVGLHFMIQMAKTDGRFHEDIESIWDVFLWWTSPERMLLFFLLRINDRCLVPFVRLGLAIIFKWTIIGKFTPLDQKQKTKAWNRFAYWLMQRLLSKREMSQVSKLVGTHYGFVSLIFRALGAKIGKYVYWPGSGLEIVEYDLLEVGDNVTFGSRSVVMTSSATRSDKVIFESGSMVADRCVVLPGTKLCQGAILGSGGLGAEDFIAPVGSVWVGSKRGCAVKAAPTVESYASKERILSPFARAFYLRDVDYFVIPLSVIILTNILWQAVCVCYKNSAVPLTLITATYLMNHEVVNESCSLLMCCFFLAIVVQLVQTFLALGIDIVAKWKIIGRRVQGEFSWDKSSYCQRWQMHLTIHDIVKNHGGVSSILDALRGSYWLVLYFRALGCSIGRNVCLYPNGGDPMMTEPDLVSIGDGTSIDNASLISHINTRGVFMLRHLHVGSHCVMKNFCRLLSGASMEDHSILLEHTLTLSGETVDKGRVWQGWPSERKLLLEDYRWNMRRAVTSSYFVRSGTTQTGSSSGWSNDPDLTESPSDSPDNSLKPLLKDDSIILFDPRSLNLRNGRYRGYGSTSEL